MLYFIFIFISIIHPTYAGNFTHSTVVTDKGSLIFSSAEELNRWYSDKSSYCGKNNRPAYLCTGVFIRITNSSKSFYPWDPSQWSKQANGIPFSWIRSDFNFNVFMINHRHGYILYPQDFAPKEKNHFVKVRCGYPFDADTWHRPDACGARDHKHESFPCNTIGVNNSIDWVDNFKKASKNRIYQCAFNFENDNDQHAYRLSQLIQSRYHASNPDIKNINNEFIMAPWPSGTGSRLPIHSFFYIGDNKADLRAAQYDKKRFFDLYNISIPIVKITPPKSITDTFKFEVFKEDQLI